MSPSNPPSHIRLPPQQDPSDVFSRDSALATTPLTPSAPSTPLSPGASGSPYGGGSRLRAGGQAQGPDYLTPNNRTDASISGSGAKSRRTTFLNANSPSSQHPPTTTQRRARNSVSRNSFASSTARYPRDRRMSRASTIGRRVSLAVNGADEEEHEGEAKIPTLALGIRPAYSTPLPVLPMLVLSIGMMSELLSANVCTPFLLQMVEGFLVPADQEPTSEQSSSIGLWTGNLVSVFYITQFLTSLLWSGIADRHGRRAVLIFSLLGSAIAVITFGTSGSLPEAIAIRLVQGLFAGNIGVVRGSIRDITDSTNETRAYALLSFCWGFGGVVGPILGGVLESPARKFPSVAGNITLFRNYPYLLPTLIAGIILSCGALLATGLSWDGGPRRKKITLPIEKDEPLVNDAIELSRPSSPSPGAQVSPAGSLRKKASSVFLSENVAAVVEDGPAEIARVLAQRDLEAQERARRASRNSIGAAVGYGGIRVKREFMAQQAAAARRESMATLRQAGDDGEYEEEEHRTLAERFMIANEQNTFNLNDLWVSAAIAQDTSVFDDDDGDELDEESQDEEAEGETQPREHIGSTLHTPASKRDGRSPSASPAATKANDERSPLLEHADPMRKSRMLGVGHPSGEHPRTFSINRVSGNHANRRFSTASGMPAIFANTGLRTPPAVAAAYETDPFSHEEALPSPTVPGPSYGYRKTSAIDPIVEGVASNGPAQRAGLSAIQESANGSQVALTHLQDAVADAEPTGWRSLPLLIICSSAALALHDTVHGQIFLSFIFTPYSGGGLGLEPADFSFLVAIMCGVQLYLQFVAYPRLPPRGGLTHLQMFRLGTCLFIPAYLTLPLLRSFVTPGKSGGPVIMTLLTLNMAIRYAGGTFGYTSIMILINAMSPPKSVGLANGLSQSLVSLSRFTGPVVGGFIWSSAIRGNPSGYFFPFWVVTGVCLVQLGLTYLIR